MLNIYLVVEGPVGEKQVYTHWVPLVNPALSVVASLADVRSNNLVIYSGGGYPKYFDVIRAGIEDVYSNPHIDRLVIAVDSEEMSYEEKRREIVDFVASVSVAIDYRIIVQHFCLETWALGNQVVVTRYPKDERLREYRHYYDVLIRDPELLPGYPPQQLNRSQFASHYLKKILNEKYKKLTYTKSNPAALLHEYYYDRVKARLETTGHIRSFNDFLCAFV
jgi:hypothetical protein